MKERRSILIYSHPWWLLHALHIYVGACKILIASNQLKNIFLLTDPLWRTGFPVRHRCCQLQFHQFFLSAYLISIMNLNYFWKIYNNDENHPKLVSCHFNTHKYLCCKECSSKHKNIEDTCFFIDYIRVHRLNTNTQRTIFLERTKSVF